MIRDSTTEQYDNLQRTDARDVTIMRWEHSGQVELISCSGEVIFNGEVYEEGGFDHPTIEDHFSATIILPRTQARAAEVENRTWENGICQIMKLPAEPGDGNTYQSGEEYLQLDGVISSSSFRGRKITVQVIHEGLAGSKTPRLTSNQFFTTILTAGSIIENDGSTLVLESAREDGKTVERSKYSGIRGPLTAGEINEFRQGANEIKLNGSASGAHVPIPFGPVPMPGRIVNTWVDGSDTIFLVLFGHGELYEYDQIFINNAVPTSGVELRLYRGGIWQDVDSWISGVDGGYADNGVYIDAKGQIGAQYLVAKIPANELGGEPFFQANAKGVLVFDPDSTSTGDPYFDDVGVSVHFTGTNGATTASDDSPNGHTITFNGDAEIQSNEVEFSGAGDVTIADHSTLRPGTDSWTIECRFTPDEVSATKTIFERYGGTSSRSIRVRQSGQNLSLQLSANGTSDAIASGTVVFGCFPTADTEYDIKLEFDAVHGHYVFWLAGDEIWRTTNSSAVHENGEDWVLGDGLDGTIRTFKFTQGHIRYNCCHTITATPFSDSASYRSGYVYSDNWALVQAEVASNPMFGAGLSVEGIKAGKDWDDTILTTEPRAQASLRIGTQRPTIDWLDYMTEYSDVFIFPDGEGMKMVPNQPITQDNPSGQQLCLNPRFETDLYWVLGDSCVISTPFKVMYWDGTQTGDSNSAIIVGGLEVGEPVAIEFDVSLVLAGEVSLYVDSDEIVAPQSAVSNTKVEFIPDATVVVLVVKADADFNGWVNTVSVRRYYWLSEGSVGDSLSCDGISNLNTPTSVTAIHTTQDSGSANWPEVLGDRYELPGVESGDLPLRNSLVYMQDFYKAEQANNYALSRLYRMRDRVRQSWLERDFALLFQKGTVVHKRDALTGVDGKYRVMNVLAVSHGRYQVTAQRYDLSHWPSEQGVSVAGLTVPENMILPLAASVAPSGYTVESSADGNFIRGTTESSEVGTTGGSASHAGFSGNTESGGAHKGLQQTLFWLRTFTKQGGVGVGNLYEPDDTEKAGHVHSYDTGPLTPPIARREMIFVKKTGGAGATIPKEVMVFGDADLNVPNLVRSTTYQGRQVMAEASNDSAGSNYGSVDFTVDSADDSHPHWTVTAVTDGDYDPVFSTPDHFEEAEEGGGPHPHDVTATLRADVRRLCLALWEGVDDYSPDQGMFGFWPLAIDLQTDPNWTLCDGTLGTPDAHNRNIEIARQGDEGAAEGDDTIRITANTELSEPHDHEQEPEVSPNTYAVIQMGHGNNVKHRHAISASSAWVPPHTKWAMFKLNPNPVLGFIDVALLISGGEADGSTTIVDDSSFSLSPTVSGSPEYDDAQQLFGLNAILNGSGDRLHYSSFTWGRKFTFEGRFRLSSSTSGSLASNGSGSEKWEVRYNAGVGLEFVVDGVVKDTTSDPGVDEWFYIAVNYDAAEFRFYYGLESTGTAALQHTEVDAIATLADDLYIGNNAAGSSAFVGHYVQIRPTRGAARHSGSAIVIPINAYATS